MARRNYRRNFARRVNRYGAGRYASRRYYSGKRYAKKANETIGLYNPGPEYLAGAAVGVTDIDNMIPVQVKLFGAALPLRGGLGGKFSRFCRGVLLGDGISALTGLKLNVLNKGASNVGWGSI